MRRTFLLSFFLLWAAGVSAIVLSACASNPSGGTIGADPSAIAPPSMARLLIQNDGGEYSGPVRDSVLGAGNANASFAQDEQAVGGVLTATFGSKSFTYSVALSTTNGTTLSGAEVASISGTCSFILNATYTSPHLLKGTYTDKYGRGCAGENGSFALTENCYYPHKGLLDAIPPENRSGAVKPNHGLHPC
jgi:hypothetical protein